MHRIPRHNASVGKNYNRGIVMVVAFKHFMDYHARVFARVMVKLSDNDVSAVLNPAHIGSVMLEHIAVIRRVGVVYASVLFYGVFLITVRKIVAGLDMSPARLNVPVPAAVVGGYRNIILIRKSRYFLYDDPAAYIKSGNCA